MTGLVWVLWLGGIALWALPVIACIDIVRTPDARWHAVRGNARWVWILALALAGPLAAAVYLISRRSARLGAEHAAADLNRSGRRGG